MAESLSGLPSQLGPIVDPLESAGRDQITTVSDSPPVPGDLSRRIPVVLPEPEVISPEASKLSVLSSVLFSISVRLYETFIADGNASA